MTMQNGLTDAFKNARTSSLLQSKVIKNVSTRASSNHTMKSGEDHTATILSGGASDYTERIYKAGLKQTVFKNEITISDCGAAIPIFRTLNYEGDYISDVKHDLSDEELVRLMKMMVTLSVQDELLYTVQRQGRISFYIQNKGEEALQIGIGKALKQDDHLWCQYRELGVLLMKGFTMEEAAAQCFGTKMDESKGRQMPISYTKRSINLQTISTPLTSQLPQAAGAGYGFRINNKDAVSVAFCGEGASSEGDAHAAMNFAGVLRSQTLFCVRNNGWAIATPVEDQYKGDGVAPRAQALGLHTTRADGNDMIASYLTAKAMRQLIVDKKEAGMAEFMTYRYGHHSTSDDSGQYRPEGQIEAWLDEGVTGIGRMRRHLKRKNLWDDKLELHVKKAAKKEMLAIMMKAENTKKFPLVDGIFDDVYKELPWHLLKQKEYLKDHIKQYKNDYGSMLNPFESI